MPAPLALSAPQKPLPPLAAQDGATVRELVRVETQLALHRARQRLRDVAGGETSTPTAASFGVEPRLLAIFGVGGKLLAQVKQGERLFVYRRGRALPIGMRDTPEAPVFRLVGLSNTCVELDREGISLTLCLNPSSLSGN
ncbi:MAG: hypothetical protein EPN41_01085 [Candidimonas sp.]|nr:MAG: hypothetical protein EPN41_01085 [Candidimonas sp.]